MSNDDEALPYTFIEGRIVIDLASEEVPIDGSRVYATHPWNQVIPRPEPPPLLPPQRYRLTVQHNTEKCNLSDELCHCVAEAESREHLLELNAQFEAIDYHFVRLELIEPT